MAIVWFRMPPVQKILLIAAGGALGATLRYGLSELTHRLLGPGFPWGTLTANLTGCFAIGFVWALSERLALNPRVSPFLLTGVIGAFTTFSTYGLESLNLLRNGKIAHGLANILLSNLAGLALVLVGFFCARLALEASR